MTRPDPLPSVQAREVPAGASLDHPHLYLNVELGWLDFNRRVFRQATDPGIPLLERVRFVGITASNLDEFIQKRIGGLRRQEAAGMVRPSPDGRTPTEQLELVRAEVNRLQADVSEFWTAELRPLLLDEAGMFISSFSQLCGPQRAHLSRYFRERIYPVLTPLAVDPAHPFPFISNLSLSLGIRMRDPRRGTHHFARVKVPRAGGRWIQVPDSREPFRMVPVEDLVRHHAEELFPGMEIEAAHAFRVTRNADVRREEEEAEDLLAMIAEELRERRFAPVVHLEVEEEMDASMRRILLDELELGSDDLVALPGELALAECMQLAELVGHCEHHFSHWEPATAQALTLETEAPESRDIFSILRGQDVLVHHPYESFGTSVQALVEQAATDPWVSAIKQTLYRTSDDSPIVEALIRAARAGKEVAVLVEVKARFDEHNNIEWARRLEDAGVHVAYGVVGLKTHAKVLLVVRHEDGRPRAYCHVGTGNYHVRNARVYTDVGLLTADPTIGEDVINLFHYLTGHAPAQSYRQLLVAPGTMRGSFSQLIDREAETARQGGRGRIVAKMNALDDVGVIRSLYAASVAGVEVDLIVRGHCRLRPGLEGYSERIRVRSIIGRFLEHDRIFYFENAGDPAVFVGSADWRSRNLNERVEAIVPILEGPLRDRLVWILELALRDNVLSWQLDAEGRWERCRPEPGEGRLDFHEALMSSVRQANPPRRPHPETQVNSLTESASS